MRCFFPSLSLTNEILIPVFLQKALWNTSSFPLSSGVIISESCKKASSKSSCAMRLNKVNLQSSSRVHLAVRRKQALPSRMVPPMDTMAVPTGACSKASELITWIPLFVAAGTMTVDLSLSFGTTVGILRVNDSAACTPFLMAACSRALAASSPARPWAIPWASCASQALFLERKKGSKYARV